MKIKFTKRSAYGFLTCLMICGLLNTGIYTTKAETEKSVHVYLEDTNEDLGTFNSIGTALEKADGEHKTVIELLDPEYQEFVTIDKAYVTLKSKDSSKPAVIKGIDIKDNANNDTMISIEAPNVTIDSVNITALWLVEASEDTNPVGIRIAADDAVIRNCKIYDMGCRYTDDTVEGTGFNGHGIICSNEDYSSEDAAIKNPVVKHCELSGLKLGNSEALVMNGNVTGFTISDNVIHNCDNIGIDIIGYEKSEDAGFSINDRARKGVVKNNIVYDISSGENPTYRKTTDDEISACAGGIYVDGGYDVEIDGNYVENCDIGVELACEHGEQTTDKISLTNNILINNNVLGGISIGGSEDDNGNATNLTIQNNTVYNSKESCFRVQKADCENNDISKNIFIAVDEAKIYSKQDNAGTNNIHDNCVTKESDTFSDTGDRIIQAANVSFDKNDGTISFDHEGYDLTGYGVTDGENTKPAEDNDKPSDENTKPAGDNDKPSSDNTGAQGENNEKKEQAANTVSQTPVEEKTKPPVDDNTQKKENDQTTTAKFFKNQVITDEKPKAKYKITKLVEENGEVAGGNVTYLNPLSKNCKKATIKASVKINGVTFKVTAINKNAFKNCRKLKSATIGTNVTLIGKKAFFGCKQLKIINIKSSKLKTVGKKAFSNIGENPTIITVKKRRNKIQELIIKSR